MLTLFIIENLILLTAVSLIVKTYGINKTQAVVAALRCYELFKDITSTIISEAPTALKTIVKAVIRRFKR